MIIATLFSAKPDQKARPSIQPDCADMVGAQDFEGAWSVKLFGVAGWSGSGKTTLLVHLIPELVGRGLKVSTIKHAHHGFDVDQPGKDSFRHREAGATEVLVGSAHRWALMHDLRGEQEPSLDEMVARMSPVDLLIVEGFKRSPHPKLEVWRASVGKPMLQPNDPTIRAVVSDGSATGLSVPILSIDDVAGVADFILGAP